MPAIQKIRKHGLLLIIIIGLGLFLFIGEPLVEALKATFTNTSQQVGEVYGKALSIQDFQEMVNDASEVYKLRTGQNLSDAQQDQVRDQVWNEYVVYQLVQHETDKLGIYVTDAEVQNALREGTAQSLQTLPMFSGPTGRFDYTALQQFLKQRNEQKGKLSGEQMEQVETIYRLWTYTEKQLRRELLMTKYQTLFMSTILSNPVNAKQSFEDRNNTTTAVVAALPYAAISDKVEVTDADLKAAYDIYKENFRLDNELRDIKYIDVAVTASPADKQALDVEMKAIYDRLVAGEDAAAIVGSSKSQVRYTEMPLTANAFPMDIRQQLDSMAVGQVKAPFINVQDNTLNTLKLISKVNLADSILYRAFVLQAEDETKLNTRCDSVMNALNGGADFKAVAKVYGQNADSAWVTSAQLEQGSNQPEQVKFAKALYENSGVTVLDINGLKYVLKIEQKKASSVKYVAAVVKCKIDFSRETYNNAKNKMNLFMAANKDLAAVEAAAAKEGYQVVDCPNFSSNAHNIGSDGRFPGVSGTKNAVRWVFDEAKPGQISQMYECGENDHLLIVGLSAVHEKGYMPWDNKDVKEFLTAVVTAEKKGEIAAKKLSGAKTIADAQKQGAVVDTLKAANFYMTPFMAAAQAPEAKVAANLSKVKVGEVSAPIIGNAGAYLLQVLSHDKGEQKYDKATEMQMAQRQYMQMAQGIFGSLAQDAKIVDRRYKF